MLKRWNDLGLGTRIIAAVLVMVFAVVAVNYVVFVKKYRASARDAMVERAAAFTALADETKDYVATLQRRDSFRADELRAELAEIRASGGDYRDSRIFSTIPVVAGWTAAGEAAERENVDFRITAFEARNPDNEPPPGSFRHDLLTRLEETYKGTGELTVHAVDAETNSLHFMRGIVLSDDCMSCHGQPGNEWDTDGDGKDIVGFAMEGWSPGKMHGAYEVVMPLETMDAQVASFITNGLAFTGPLVVASLLVFLGLMRVVFQRPVGRLIHAVEDIAQGDGDLTQRVDASTSDELGRLGKGFNLFIEKIHDLVVQVKSASNEVAAASTEIAASSEEMAAGMEEQSGQLGQISSAIEEMSASIVEVSRKAQDASSRAGESGTAAERGGVTVHETVEGMRLINEAVRAGSESVTELGKRGEQIGEIIEVINDIAEQTNLLALNAAIEAARAGEHGRGFAVVADEVRKLADRTTKATDEIAGSIEAIQSDTRQAVERMASGTAEVDKGVAKATAAGESLETIVSSASEVATLIGTIAAAAEQQSAASEEVSRNIESINAVAAQSNEGAAQAASAATQLSDKAESLRALVAVFKVRS